MAGGGKDDYLVRGALLKCSKGTHPRRLDLPFSHGVYATTHPVMRENDCRLEDNIRPFGICTSGSPPPGAETIALEAYVPPGGAASGQVIQGLACCPNLCTRWKKPHQTTQVDGAYGAITMESYLVCYNGGLIEPLTNGAEYED